MSAHVGRFLAGAVCAGVAVATLPWTLAWVAACGEWLR